jgi:hypothetical protein
MKNILPTNQPDRLNVWLTVTVHQLIPLTGFTVEAYRFPPRSWQELNLSKLSSLNKKKLVESGFRNFSLPRSDLRSIQMLIFFGSCLPQNPLLLKEFVKRKFGIFSWKRKIKHSKIKRQWKLPRIIVMG